MSKNETSSHFNRVNLPKHSYRNISGILQRKLKHWLDLRSHLDLEVENEQKGLRNTQNQAASDRRREEKGSSNGKQQSWIGVLMCKAFICRKESSEKGGFKCRNILGDSLHSRLRTWGHSLVVFMLPQDPALYQSPFLYGLGGNFYHFQELIQWSWASFGVLVSHTYLGHPHAKTVVPSSFCEPVILHFEQAPWEFECSWT